MRRNSRLTRRVQIRFLDRSATKNGRDTMTGTTPGRARAVVRLGAIVATAALALAACSSSPSTPKASSSSKTYTIAYEGPLSGGNSQLGLFQKFAVQLAIN